ncbi:hypothetical protein L873DRAFT_870637 [Choiromyces venosus 120613-1]|uniref:Uncharacterized protein n=1 Tax=Choiromyces venosus 120613-1 TaxID=1336337 RepID=A0A3N4IRC0_9PEZI|nr:hypothetical protein L873DRAFT_870637 [Choiromyces venosus 120613-1]
MYLNHEKALIVKITPGKRHEIATSQFARMFIAKIEAMGFGPELYDIRAATFASIMGQKEADTAFQPSSRPLNADLPTLVVECGVSQSLGRLRLDSRWWLASSGREVKIVLIFSISEATRKIHIEQWEMFSAQNPHRTRANPQAAVTTATKIHVVDIVGPFPLAPGSAPAFSALVVTDAPLTLDFDKIFLRQPTGHPEGNIIFTAHDFRQYAFHVWRLV